MRVWLYILSGSTSALIGWNIGQAILYDLDLAGKTPFLPEFFLFPCVSISLAIGLVITEIFVSNPTLLINLVTKFAPFRLVNFINLIKIPCIIAIAIGLVSGILGGGLFQLLRMLGVETLIARALAWLIIGGAVGFTEGFTWRWRSVEAGNRKKFRTRIRNSFTFGCLGSICAVLIFEVVRKSVDPIPDWFRPWEAPLGLILLGLLIALGLSLTSSPSYMAALRAGSGFEYEGPIYAPATAATPTTPYIDRAELEFVSQDELDEIEEGLSIQLPDSGEITIGSNSGSQICIPGLPGRMATFIIKARSVHLKPEQQTYQQILINGVRLTNPRKKALKHNTVITFFALLQGEKYEEKVYQFVYYNRFLDPQS